MDSCHVTMTPEQDIAIIIIVHTECEHLKAHFPLDVTTIMNARIPTCQRFIMTAIAQIDV